MRALRSSVGLAGVFVLSACVDAIPTMPGVKPGVLPIAPTATFTEDFSASTLDPAWTVVPPAGTPNYFSLAANPGFLRYGVTAMTHHEGFLNSYQPAFYSCCQHAPGVELHRPITGEWWQLETKVLYNMPAWANGRQMDIRVYFGAGGPGTVIANMLRTEDCCAGGPEPTWLQLAVRDPGEVNGYPLRTSLHAVAVNDNPSGDFYYWRLQRSGTILTSSWSYNGTTWTEAFSQDMGTALAGLTQRLVISGLSWFVAAGSYADYDYVNVTSTIVPVDIDIMPGSDVNPITLNRKGKIPVAILSSADFDAPTAVDPTSLTFGHAGTEASMSHCNAVPEDVNGDALPDLICHFEATVAGFLAGDVAGHLKGSTTGGQPISGSDAITIR